MTTTEGGAVPKAQPSWLRGRVLSIAEFRRTKPGALSSPDGVSRDVLLERVSDYAATIEALGAALAHLEPDLFLPDAVEGPLRRKGWLHGK